MSDVDYDLNRITRIADEGLRRVREVDEDDDCEPGSIALDSFAIVTYRNEEGEEREGTAVFSESLRNFVQRGILEAGIGRVREYTDD